VNEPNSVLTKKAEVALRIYIFGFQLKASDREVVDIQSEFENERTDYLETIRKQERQIKLQSQILEKIVPTLSKECNYR